MNEGTVETDENRTYLAQRMEQPGFGGTGLLQQEQGLTTPHLTVDAKGCEAERQSSGVAESWPFKRLLLRGFLGPSRGGEWASKSEREGWDIHETR